jgi:tetratricopeptide (TPR) repeat protein
VQPLPPAEGARLDQAALQISKSLAEARRQLADERRCEMAIAAGKNDSAIVYARNAINTYAQSTLARVCLAQAMVNAKMPADSVLTITDKVLEIDPRNRPALQLAARAYVDANQDEKAVQAWTRLISLDPTNTRMIEEAVRFLGVSGNAIAAKPIIEEAVSQNPGVPELVRLKWLISLAIRDWKGAIATGEELLAANDSVALADTAFFVRLAAAYQADSQPQKAAEATARGVAKFAQNATLWSLHSQMLRGAGQLQQAMEAARRALEIKPSVEGGWLRLAQIYDDMQMPDSAVAALRQGAANGGDKTTIGQALLVHGNKAFRAGNASKKREDFERAVSILTIADSLAPSANSKFLLGASAFYVGDLAMRENQKAKSCELATLAEQHLTLAQINLPQGGSVAQEAATQLLNAASTDAQYVEKQKKSFCKNR